MNKKQTGNFILRLVEKFNRLNLTEKDLYILADIPRSRFYDYYNAEIPISEPDFNALKTLRVDIRELDSHGIPIHSGLLLAELRKLKNKRRGISGQIN